MEALSMFLHQFTVCLLWKRKFVVCPFVDEETNGRQPVCKQTKQTKWTCPSMINNHFGWQCSPELVFINTLCGIETSIFCPKYQYLAPYPVSCYSPSLPTQCFGKLMIFSDVKFLCIRQFISSCGSSCPPPPHPLRPGPTVTYSTVYSEKT